ncbi:uncharacterized protein [Acropora muricata]|uniref:uncharacterized protein n=1 Tax=Acropora muricata TaxID=159855 RepID=UPI0034E55F69
MQGNNITMLVSACFVFLLGFCVHLNKGYESIALLTNIFNSSTDVQKVYSSLQKQSSVTNVDFLLLQLGYLSSFNTLSKGENWSLWQVTEKDVLLWLSDRKPSTLICVTDNIDIPHVLLSEKRKGLLPLTKIVVWIVENTAVTERIKAVQVMSAVPGDLTSQMSTALGAGNVNVITFNNPTRLFLDILHMEHHARLRRAVIESSSSSPLKASLAGSSTLSGSASRPISSSTLDTLTSSKQSVDLPATSSAVLSPLITSSPSIVVVGESHTAKASPSMHLQSVAKKVETSSSSTTKGTSTLLSLTVSVADTMSPTSTVVALFSGIVSSNTAFTSSSSTTSSSMVGKSSEMATSFPTSSSQEKSGSLIVTSSAVVAPPFSQSGSKVTMGTSSKIKTVVTSSSSVISSPVSSGSTGFDRSSGVVATAIPPSSSGAVLTTSSTKLELSLSSSVAITTSISALTRHPSPERSLTDNSVAASAQVNSSSSHVMLTDSPSIVSLDLSSIPTKLALTSSFGFSTPSFVGTGIVSLTSLAVGSFTLYESEFASKTTRTVQDSTMSPYSSRNFTRSLSTVSSEKASVVSSSQKTSPLPSTSSIFLSSKPITVSVQSTFMSSYSSYQTVLSFASVSNRKASASSFSQTSSFSSFVTDSYSWSQSSSQGSSSTGMTIVSSILTSAPVSPDTTVMSPSSTKVQPTSSQVASTEPPLVYRNETITVKFDGKCEGIVGDKNKEEQFKVAFKDEVSKKLNIKKSFITVNDITCGSILVTFTATTATEVTSVADALNRVIKSDGLIVSAVGKNFKATSFQVVHPTTAGIPATTTKTPTENNTKLILYITFSVVIGVIFIVGIVGLIVRYRRDQQRGGFFLTNASTNYELRRFHGVPRSKNYSKVNYYGEPVELDATAADPNAPDEFQAQQSDFQYDQGSSLDRVKPIAESNDDKFNVGTMGLPEWKNLPRLSKAEVAVTDDSKSGTASMSMDEGKTQLLHNESPSLGNPIVTFGDGAAGLEKKDGLAFAYDNPAVTEEDGLPAPEK